MTVSSGNSEKDLSVWKNSVWVWLCSKGEVNTHRQQCKTVCSLSLSKTHRWSPAGRIQESSTPPTAAAGRNSSSWWSNLAVQQCHPLAVWERERRCWRKTSSCEVDLNHLHIIANNFNSFSEYPSLNESKAFHFSEVNILSFIPS